MNISAAENTSRRWPRITWARASIAAFFILLWIGSSWWFFGDIGKSRDDYTWVVRIPETGTFNWIEMWTIPSFWRPLSLVLVRHMLTVFWDHPWINHLISALAHALVAWCLWQVLRSVTRPRIAAMSAAIFLVFPLSFDVVYWPAAVPTSLSTATVLGIFAVCLNDARRPGPLWKPLSMIALLAAATPCFNEQPATVLPLIPLLYFAFEGRRLKKPRTWTRPLLLSATCGGLCLAYVLLLAATASPGQRGSTGRYTPVEQLAERTWTTAEQAAQMFVGPPMRDMIIGGAAVGWEQITHLAGILWLVATAIAGLGALCFISNSKANPAKAIQQDNSPRKPAWFALVALTAFVLGWLPFILVQTGPLEPRHAYFPQAMLIILVAVLADSAVARLGHLRLARYGNTCILWFTGAAIIFSAVSLIGFQSVFRTRSQIDVQQVANIMQALPNPPSGSVLVILNESQRASNTGRKYFDRAVMPPWRFDHVSTAVIRHAYGRSDLYAKHAGSLRWVPPDSVTPSDWTTNLSNGPRWWPQHLGGGVLEQQIISWDRIYPIMIDNNGQVRLANELRIEKQNLQDFLLPLAHVDQVTNETQSASHPLSYSVQEIPPATTQEQTRWKWTTSNEPVQVKRVSAWGKPHNALTLQAAKLAHPRSKINLEITANTRPVQLAFRTTIPQRSLQTLKDADITLTWTLHGLPEPESGQITLDRKTITNKKGWIPLIISIPQSDSDLSLQINATTSSPAPVPILITPGRPFN